MYSFIIFIYPIRFLDGVNICLELGIAQFTSCNINFAAIYQNDIKILLFLYQFDSIFLQAWEVQPRLSQCLGPKDAVGDAVKDEGA